MKDAYEKKDNQWLRKDQRSKVHIEPPREKNKKENPSNLKRHVVYVESQWTSIVLYPHPMSATIDHTSFQSMDQEGIKGHPSDISNFITKPYDMQQTKKRQDV